MHSSPNGLWPMLCGEFAEHGVEFLEPEPAADSSRRLALVLAYDGGNYAGWQVQPKARTVQGEIEAALSKLCDHPVRLAASGRTDAGVHAMGQVAVFDTFSRLGVEEMARGLQALLPEDIHLRKLGAVDQEFHPRFGALAKTYDYYLWPEAQAPLFLRGYTWPIKHELDFAAMSQAVEQLPGERDLAAMASRRAEVVGSTVRRILAAELVRHEHGLWRFSITATGFLRHVVRNLVGSLVQIGSARLTTEGLMEMLAKGQRLYPGPKALPGGLYLARVYYREIKMPFQTEDGS